MSDPNVGFVGLGNVGSKVANNIISNGYNYLFMILMKKNQKF